MLPTRSRPPSVTRTNGRCAALCTPRGSLRDDRLLTGHLDLETAALADARRRRRRLRARGADVDVLSAAGYGPAAVARHAPRRARGRAHPLRFFHGGRARVVPQLAQ